MAHLHLYCENDRLSYVKPREGEIKLGETIGLASPGADLESGLRNSAARFVLLGLPEDIGVRANGGIGGAHTAWNNFLKSFMNIQQAGNLRGADFLLLGEMDFTDWMVSCADAGLEQLRKYTAHMDAEVYPVIRTVIGAGKIPLVIGGGHNNAYPLIKGASLALNKAFHVLNLDAHSDFRVAEGRHSGNGFRYAYQEGFLKKYAMLGLHEAYNSEGVVAELKNNPDLLPLFWEDIFLRNKSDWNGAIHTGLDFVRQQAFGVELDVDCIENALSSAATPVGISTQQALQYLYRCGQTPEAVYLHLPEGVTERADGQHNTFTGKLLSYLVQAFVKGVLER
jgi:formiminoglutamase